MARKIISREVTKPSGERLMVEITLDIEALTFELCAKATKSVGKRATLRGGLITATPNALHIDYDGLALKWGHTRRRARRIAGGRVLIRGVSMSA